MSALLATVTAQVGAELRTRLRSPGTVIALLALLAGSYLWIPNPEQNAASISWQEADGQVRAPLFSAAYLGVAMAILAGFFLLVIAFYLIAGSVRRDRERRVGMILAATPISKSAYLLGKLAAHAAYLGTLTLLVLPVGLYNFARFGVGRLDPVPFLLPTALVAIPGIVFVSAMALLFDVTPVLGSRGGPVIWFFTGMTLVAAVPMMLSGADRGAQAARFPPFDPSGMASLNVLIVRSVPAALPKSFSTGLIFHDQPIRRVPWPGIEIDGRFVAGRALDLLWAVPPFLLAVLLFDRFDPARGRIRGRRGTSAEAAGTGLLSPASETPPAPALAPPDLSRLSPVAVHPSAWGAILAEARLLWQTASWLRWPLAAAALVTACLPAPAVPFGSLAFLVLLAPGIAEAAARESLAGSGPLVFSQPGVPRSAVLWKGAALALFVLAIGLPPLVRAAALSPARGFAFLTGLLFVAALATATGYLSGGGKLFLGLYLWLWYAASSRVPAADFCGVMGGALGPAARAAYLALGAVAIGIAWGWERRRRQIGRS